MNFSISDDLNGISFGQDSDGNWGYIKAGADTVTPFKNINGLSGTLIINIKYNLLLGCYYQGSEDYYSPTLKTISSTITIKFTDGIITSKTCTGGNGKSGKGSNGLFGSSDFWGLVNSFRISSVSWEPS